MGDTTGIKWTDHTFNPWIGCSKIHTGCTNCYAEADFDTRRHVAYWGANGTRIKTSDDNWRKPDKWDRDAARDGVIRKVFCASLADFFEVISPDNVFDHHNRPIIPIDNFPRLGLDDLRLMTLGIAGRTHNLIWQLLTKRPGHAKEFLLRQSYYPHNIWLGTSISDQATALEMIPQLIACRGLASKLFISYEPATGPVDWSFIFATCKKACGGHQPIDWVIVGGESGHNARPCHQNWIRQTVNECQSFRVPLFVKQLGMVSIFGADRRFETDRLKGDDPTEWPDDIRVQQFPTARTR